MESENTNESKMSANTKLMVKFVLDLVVLLSMGFVLLAFGWWVTPHRRGYFPDDRDLMLPFKHQTISEVTLALVGFALNIITIIAVEVLRRSKLEESEGQKRLWGRRVPGWVFVAYRLIGIFTFGAAAQQITTMLAKYAVGRLRPHFFDLCRPVPNSSLSNGYVLEYTCQGTDLALLKDMKLSFPSAHSSFAMYAALFFILYTHVRVTYRGVKLAVPALQFAAVLGAWYTALSRVAEHMHHWGDVAAGILIGSFYAIIVFMFVLKPHKLRGKRSWVEEGPRLSLPRPVGADAR